MEQVAPALEHRDPFVHETTMIDASYDFGLGTVSDLHVRELACFNIFVDRAAFSFLDSRLD